MKSSADFGCYFKLEAKFGFEYHNDHLVGLLSREVKMTLFVFRGVKSHGWTFYDPVNNERQKAASGR